MTATRHEARGGAREPDGGTPGRHKAGAAGKAPKESFARIAAFGIDHAWRRQEPVTFTNPRES